MAFVGVGVVEAVLLEPVEEAQAANRSSRQLIESWSKVRYMRVEDIVFLLNKIFTTKVYQKQLSLTRRWL